jgi:hypothetical protein
MRKSFQPGANVPMVTETHRRLALELRMSTETLINQPTVEAFNRLSKMFAALCHAGLVGEPINQATDVMCVICDRYERVDRIGLKEAEAESLRQSVAAIDGALPKIPVNKFKEAVAMVEAFCITVGA